MTILRLDLDAGGWRAVPPAIFEDQRLSLDSRGVAGYISTRSETFFLSVSGLCYLLRIGEEKWRRISHELTTAGYLKKTQAKDQRGRFRFELLFSPVPAGGFPKNQSRQSGFTTPKILTQPDTDKRTLAPPPLVNPGSTIEKTDRKIEYHHPSNSGGGDNVQANNSQIPQIWIDAANFEISLEEQLRPIKNRAGLFRKIVDRYWENGGPDETTVESMKSAQKLEAASEAKAKAAHEQAKREQERADLDAKRHSEAETRAKLISCDARKVLLLEVQKKVRNDGSVRAQSAFIELGEISLGPLRLSMIESLLTR